MQGFLDLIMSNRLYMAIAAILLIGFMIFLLKKVMKLILILIALFLAYGVFLFATEDDPMQALKDKFTPGKSMMKKLDEASGDLKQEALDKVMDEVDKKLKKAGNQ